MSKYTALLCTVFMLNIVYGQKKQYSGFMGHKFLIQTNLNVFNPFLSNRYSVDGYSVDQFKASGSQLKPIKDYMDWEAKVGFTYYPKRNIGFGVDVGILNFQLSPGRSHSLYWNSSSGYLDNFYLNGKYENLDCSYTSIMPKIELSSASGLLPVGIAHTIGIGYNMVNIKEKNYLYELDQYDLEYMETEKREFVENLTKNSLIEYTKIKAYTLMYGLTMRLPLTDRLLFSYNLNYTLNYIPGVNEDAYFNPYNNPSQNAESKYVLDKNRLTTMTRKELFRNVIKIGVGLAFTI